MPWMHKRLTLNILWAYFLASFMILAPIAVAESPGWTPDILNADSPHYLPNYSYAGYYWGEKKPPQLTATMDISDFGAIPDDGKDDTLAIQKAMGKVNNTPGPVVLHFPKGRFILQDIIFISRSNLVIQGEGSGPQGTTIYVARPLGEMNYPLSFSLRKLYYIAFGKWSNGKLFSLFSWAGGVFWSKQPDDFHQQQLDVEVSQGERGKHEIQVKNTTAIKVGDVLEIQWFNHEGQHGSLLKHIFGDYDIPIGERLYKYWYFPLITQPVTVARLENQKIIIKEPLLHDLRGQWFPTLVKVNYLENIGIEKLKIEFPTTSYGGHHLEAGFNAFYLTDLAHSWVRNVVVHNADAAVLTDNCKNITLDGIVVTGRVGHYSVHTGNCYGMLTQNFDFQSAALHNPSFNTRSRLSVYSGGSIKRAKLDQHNGLNHQNLFDNIHIETAEDVFRHGGARYWQPTAGLYNTFWNIRIDNSRPDGFIGSLKDAPESRLIGIVGENADIKFHYEPNAYIEGINKKGISVPSLYQHQLHQRLLQ